LCVASGGDVLLSASYYISQIMDSRVLIIATELLG